MGLRRLIIFNEDLRYSLVPGNVRVCYKLIKYMNADKYSERRGVSDSYSITKSRSTSISVLSVNACGLSTP